MGKLHRTILSRTLDNSFFNWKNSQIKNVEIAKGALNSLRVVIFEKTKSRERFCKMNQSGVSLSARVSTILNRV